MTMNKIEEEEETNAKSRLWGAAGEETAIDLLGRPT